MQIILLTQIKLKNQKIMKEKFSSFFSFLKECKILLRLNMAVILLLSFALNVSAEEIDDINRNPSGTNQQVTVRGTVTEASTGNPIPGVNVEIGRAHV